ncbi:Hint domain-containing protein [Sagittula sp. SSi028]|uniref:Hint domain-containing protein n=1 Tax=Sagittula sp. SSi028 TaxID=3400636 RepID=UPI003AF6A0D1
MATYSVTTANWNDAGFWSGISATPGDKLDFSALGDAFSVRFDADTGYFLISDGTASYIVGQADRSGGNARFASGRLSDFTFVTAPDGGSAMQSGGRDDTLWGGDGSDTLMGGRGDDSMVGGAGSDVFAVGEGNDTVVGGDDTATDYLSFVADGDGVSVTFIDEGEGSFSDVDSAGSFDGIEGVVLNDNDDSVDAGATTQGVELYGAGGSDTLTGGSGDDYISGGEGDDSLTGNAGNDQINGGEGRDTLSGGDGSDTLEGGAGRDSITAGSGDDVVLGGGGADTILGGTGNDTIHGDNGDIGTVAGTLSSFDCSTISETGGTGDGIIGTYAVYDNVGVTDMGVTVQIRLTIVDADDPNMDVSFGNNSVWINDSGMSASGTCLKLRFEAFDQATGAPILISGALTFTDVDTTSETVSVDASDVTGVSVSSTPASHLTVSSTGEMMTVQSDNTSSTPADEDHWAQFHYADQHNLTFGVTARGAGTNYTFSMQEFTNTPVTTAPSADPQSDSIDAGAGDDLVYGGAGADTIDGGAGSDTLQGNGGNDLLRGGDDADIFVVSDAFHNDTIVGGEGAGTTSDTDRLDFENLSHGVDVTLSADEAGSASDGADSVNFSEIEAFTLTTQADTFDASTTGAGVFVNASGGDDSVIGSGGDDELHGGSGADTLRGDAGADTIHGDGGEDSVHGNEGDDSLDGGAGNDSLYGDAGNDWVSGGAGDDTVEGNEGDDTLLGGEGNDWLRGSFGNDALHGGAGDDYLWGGWGDDTFVIENGFGNDTVDAEGVDETTGDVLDLSAVTDDLTINLTAADGESGTVSDGTGTLSFVEIERIVLGGGRDTIILADGSGVDRIEGFDLTNSGDGSANDQLDVSGLTSDGTTPVTAGDVTVTDDGSGNAVLSFPGGEQITLIGVAPASLSTLDDLYAIGLPATRDHIVEGTAGADVIDGSYVGDPDGDRVDAGDSTAGTDDDSIDAGAGDDVISAGAGNDTVRADEGDDTVYGGAGDDVLYGYEGSDSIYGGDGDDLINTRTSVGTARPDTPYPSLYSADTDPGNDRDTAIGGAGNDTILTGDDADYVEGGTGNDSIEAGIDDDTVFGGSGADTILADEGNDSVDGGTGDDLIYGDGTDTVTGPLNVADDTDPAPTNSRDTLSGGDGSDSIYGMDDADTLYGDAGDDLVDGGIDDDVVYGGTGRDTVLGGDGSDTLYGGLGDDRIDGGADADRIVLEDGFGADTVSGGETVTYGTDDDTLDAGGLSAPVSVTYTGSEAGMLRSGTNTAEFDGIEGLTLTSGDDTVAGAGDSAGIDINAGAGADRVTGGAGDDSVSGDAGDDTLTGGAGSDTLRGGDGADRLRGGDGGDLLDGGSGDDNIQAGSGDTVLGGAGDDVFNTGPSHITGTDFSIIGGETGETSGDTLNVTGPATITMTGAESGTVTWSDGTTLTFSEIETVNYVPCFTPGTRVKTDQGEIDVAEIAVGDRILTRDNGYQPVRWRGTKALGHRELCRDPSLQPVLIRAHAFGPGRPERDMLVSPQHRLSFTGAQVQMLTGEEEVLAAACHALDHAAVQLSRPAQGVEYIHFMFDHHELVMSDGVWTESFQPGVMSLAGLDQRQRVELLHLFPELAQGDWETAYASARPALRQYQARLLMAG